jgi:hypothetical protein
MVWAVGLGNDSLSLDSGFLRLRSDSLPSGSSFLLLGSVLPWPAKGRICGQQAGRPRWI